MMRNIPRGFLRGTSGVSLVEAALVTPLLVFLTLSIAEFGVLFHVYLALEHGVTQATRYGVTGNQMEELSREDSLRGAMRQATPTLTIPDEAFEFSHLSPGATVWADGTGGPDDIEKMTVDYNWPVVNPMLRPFFTGGQMHFRVESSRKNERRFE
jgi:hypothetical protein